MRASARFVSSGASFVRQFAQGHGQVARGAFQPLGAGFQFLYIILRAHRDRRQRVLNLHGQTLGFSLRLFFGPRQRSRFDIELTTCHY
jgi:hypothetical protein